MTQDERISSYIDNELTPEQEQEFLISLAASDTLRRSFRSELVMKKVLHRDERMTAPPREMRAAVFATLGLATAGSLAASKADAATPAPTAPAPTAPAPTAPAPTAPTVAPIAQHAGLRALFATKVNTLITAAGISLSALAGYGVHAVVSEHSDAAATHQSVTAPATAPATAIQQQNQVATAPVTTAPATTALTAQTEAAQPQTHAKLAVKKSGKTAAAKTAVTSESHTPTTINGVSGTGDVTMDPPRVDPSKQ